MAALVTQKADKQTEYDWLHELLEIGRHFEEMAELLIDGETASP